MSDRQDGITRRGFLTGGDGFERGAPEEHCISSAVVSVLPHREAEMVGRLGAMPGVEVRGAANGKLVLVLEGPGSGAVGALLASISVMDGIVAANMVFEHVE